MRDKERKIIAIQKLIRKEEKNLARTLYPREIAMLVLDAISVNKHKVEVILRLSSYRPRCKFPIRRYADEISQGDILEVKTL